MAYGSVEKNCRSICAESLTNSSLLSRSFMDNKCLNSVIALKIYRLYSSLFAYDPFNVAASWHYITRSAHQLHPWLVNSFSVEHCPLANDRTPKSAGLGSKLKVKLKVSSCDLLSAKQLYFMFSVLSTITKLIVKLLIIHIFFSRLVTQWK